MAATVLPFPGGSHTRHPPLGPCALCGAGDVRPLVDESTVPGVVVGARCAFCGFLASLEEFQRRTHAVQESRATP